MRGARTRAFECVFSPFPKPGGLPQVHGVLNKWGLCGLLAYISDRGPSCLMCCLCRHQYFFPCSAQKQPWVQVPFIPHSWSLPPAFATLLCSHTAELIRPVWTLGMYWEVSCG